ncbi:LacI family DNA-binding transcriptional regulator [Aliiglaciecola litoralis]|uniref:LacI family DNA-binding transcriptional regulator n=1 Tax=Aliiglaciecola litoralis TaxID=582857 RepID=A0ABP3WRV3_9ALTE
MASIKDVAVKANVSVKTVSRILSGYQGVSAKTKDNVLRAMEELEYYPSAAAQALRGQEKGIVSVITEKLTTTPDAFEIIAGIQAECEKQGKLLMIGESGGKPASFAKLVDDFRRHRSQAIIYATLYHREVKIEQSFNHCPLILVNCFEKTLRHPTIVPDDSQGLYDATKSLLQAGHRRIAYLTLFEEMRATQLRKRGFEKAMLEADVPVDPNLIIEGVCTVSDDEFSKLPDVLRNIMALQDRPTAILCGNDKMAMRIYMLIRRMGYKIPETISIVGYDNYKLIAENLLPRLTTVSLPYFRMGELAAKLAIDKIIEPREEIVCGDLIMRDSLSAPYKA